MDYTGRYDSGKTEANLAGAERGKRLDIATKRVKQIGCLFGLRLYIIINKMTH